jgi:hypothetical protein
VRWLLLCAGKLCENLPDVTGMALREQVRVHGMPECLPACLPAARAPGTTVGTNSCFTIPFCSSCHVLCCQFALQTHELLAKLLGADSPDVRAAAVYTLGAFVQASEGGLGSGGSGSAPPSAPASPSPTPAGGSEAAAAAVPPAAAAAGAAGTAEGPLPDAERLAVERAIACALLEVVYDASPLVRCEGEGAGW